MPGCLTLFSMISCPGFASGHLKLFHSGCNGTFIDHYLMLRHWKQTCTNAQSSCTKQVINFIWSRSRVPMKGEEMWPSQTRHVGRVQKKSIIILLDRTKDVKYRRQSHEPDQRSRLQMRHGGGPQHMKEAPANQSAAETFTHPPLNHRYTHCSPQWHAKSSCCWEQNVLHGDSDMLTSATVQTKYELCQSVKLQLRSPATLIPRPLKCG